MTKPFVSQWYWQQALIHPYRKSKVWYHGPREKWMKLVKVNKKIKRNRNKYE